MKALGICGGPNYATDSVFSYLFYLKKRFQYSVCYGFFDWKMERNITLKRAWWSIFNGFLQNIW